MSRKRAGEIYTHLYKQPHINSDTPYKAQIQVARAIINILRRSQTAKKILHVGAGTGQLEKEMLASYVQKQDKKLLQTSLFCTLDIAKIDRRKLASSKRYQIVHVQADGSFLPFKDDGFDIVVSNMAIDFMPGCAIHEMARVLKNNANFILTLHHPIMMQQILHDISTLKTDLSDKQRIFLRDFICNRMFKSKRSIAKTLLKHGLICEQILHKKTNHTFQQNDHWWFVYGHKYPSIIR